jgi:hypothetical protein
MAAMPAALNFTRGAAFLLTLWLAPAALAQQSADLGAETMAHLSDLLAPYSASVAPPRGADPRVLSGALEALRKEKLLGAPRPATGETDIVERYGRALMLGTRAPEFKSEIAAVRDAVVRGDPAATRESIRQTYTKAGRRAPEGQALDDLVKAVKSTGSDEPPETIHHEIKRLDYDITIEDQRAAGKIRTEVTRRGPDGQPERTEFVGDVVTRPNAAGTSLERAVTPTAPPRTVTQAESTRLRETLNGRWRDQDGATWEVSGAGAEIVLTHLRPVRTTLTYRGRYALARATGTHVFQSPDDMDPDLPDWVRAGLVGMGQSFRVALTANAAGDRLEGTWSSQHVTYSPSYQTIEKVHDPFDRRLTLTRAAEKVAQGGRFPEDGP